MRKLLPKPKIGDKYGKWTIIKYGPLICFCKCACGQTANVTRNNLVRGKTTKCCFCRRKFKSNAKPKIHCNLMSRVSGAISRCTNKKDPSYFRYGGRGIKIHQPWIDNPAEFINYLLTISGHDDFDLVIDRINNNGDYEPGNIRFVTRKNSANNRRPPPKRTKHIRKTCAFCKIIFAVEPSLKESRSYCGKTCWRAARKNHMVGTKYTYKGLTMTLKAWGKKLSISYHALRCRLKSGLPVNKAFTK